MRPNPVRTTNDMQYPGYFEPTTPAPDPWAGPHRGLPVTAGGVPLPDPRLAITVQRTREMTLDELLLENRVIFLVGGRHIGAQSATLKLRAKRWPGVRVFVTNRWGVRSAIVKVPVPS